MKNTLKYALLVCLCSLSFSIKAQDTAQNDEAAPKDLASIEVEAEEEDSAPSIFKFEPDYLTSVETERKEVKENKEILDTLSVSERRRKKLLKRMFKNDFKQHLSKKGLVGTKYEDTE